MQASWFLVGVAVGVVSPVTRPKPVIVVVDAPRPTADDHLIRVTKDEITYGGRLVTSVSSARCPDSPCFVVETLLDALRADIKRPREIPISIDDDLASGDDTSNIRLRLLFTILRAGNDAVVRSL